MRITFYKSSAERERVDKTDYIVAQLTVEGYLRAATSVLNPTVLINANSVSVPNSQSHLSKSQYIVGDDEKRVTDADGNLIVASGFFEQIKNCNYAYIPDFGRYYFIVDVTSVRTDLWSVTLQVDPLMSHRDEIYGQTLYCERTALGIEDPISLTGKIPDNLLPMKADLVITDAETTSQLLDYNGSSFQSRSENDHPIIVTCVGPQVRTVTPPSSIGVPSSGLTTPDSSNIPSSWEFAQYAISWGEFVNLYSNILNNDTLRGYIISCILYPFDCGASGETEEYIQIGGTSTPCKGVSVNQSKVHVHRLACFQLNKKYSGPLDYLNYSPYSKYQLFLPYKGWIDLDPSMCLGKDIAICYAMDPTDGSATVYVSTRELDEGSLASDPYKGNLIYSGICQLGIKMSFASTNARELTDQKISATTSLVLSEIGSVIGIAGGVAAMNPVVVAGGVAGGIGAVTKYGVSQIAQHQTAQATLGGGEMGFYAPQTAILRESHQEPSLDDDESISAFWRKLGRPYARTVALSDLKGTGFANFSNILLSGFDSSFSAEVNSIIDYLQKGVIL